MHTPLPTTESPTAALRSLIEQALTHLAHLPCGYRDDSKPAAEPTSLAMLALAGAGRLQAALAGVDWLGSLQLPDGSLAPMADLKSPGWATPLAILATAAATRETSTAPSTEPAAGKRFDLQLAKQWLIATVSKPLPWSNEFGHDSAIIGWPWVGGTHSWVEPTAWSVLALKSLGKSHHPRTREGVQMLIDRLLVTGGCNYGNTVVLGQRLRPHVEPSGLAMLALAGEPSKSPRIHRTLQYLLGVLNSETTPISLSYGLLGLAAFERAPAQASDWLAEKFREVFARDRSPLKLALLTLAAQGRSCPLIQAVTQGPTA